MTIKDFTEKKIRQRILQKLRPSDINSGKHDKGYIYLDEKLITKVKIPNEHTRIMHQNKSKLIASALRLTHDEFNQLIDCTLSGPDYYSLIRKKVNTGTE